MNRKDFINASELGEFIYCQHAYWLAQQGETPTVSRAMREGSAAHRHLNEQVDEVTRRERRSSVGFAVALLLLLLVGVVLILTRL